MYYKNQVNGGKCYTLNKCWRKKVKIWGGWWPNIELRFLVFDIEVERNFSRSCYASDDQERVEIRDGKGRLRSTSCHAGLDTVRVGGGSMRLKFCSNANNGDRTRRYYGFRAVIYLTGEWLAHCAFVFYCTVVGGFPLMFVLLLLNSKGYM